MEGHTWCFRTQCLLYAEKQEIDTAERAGNMSGGRGRVSRQSLPPRAEE